MSDDRNNTINEVSIDGELKEIFNRLFVNDIDNKIDTINRDIDSIKNNIGNSEEGMGICGDIDNIILNGAQTKKACDGIKTQVDDVNKKIDEIITKADKIGTNLIDGIIQTNILIGENNKLLNESVNSIIEIENANKKEFLESSKKIDDRMKNILTESNDKIENVIERLNEEKKVMAYTNELLKKIDEELKEYVGLVRENSSSTQELFNKVNYTVESLKEQKKQEIGVIQEEYNLSCQKIIECVQYLTNEINLNEQKKLSVQEEETKKVLNSKKIEIKYQIMKMIEIGIGVIAIIITIILMK